MNLKKDKRLYVLFYTFAEAMATEIACKKADISGKLVSVPRKLSAGCGISWECSPSLKTDMVDLLEKENIEWEDMQEI